MIPTPITNHTEDAKAHLTSMFRSRRVIEGLLSAFINRIQTLENTANEILGEWNLDTDNDRILDMFGKIVGEPRDGRTNDDYRAAIRLKIRVNKSTGKLREFLYILFLAAHGTVWEYYPAFPAGVFAVFFDLPTFKVMQRFGGAIVPAGVSFSVGYSPELPGEVFRPDSTTGAVSSAVGPNSSVGSSPASSFVHVTER